MRNFIESFWKASLHEMKQGFIYEPPSEEWVCLICGARFMRGQIYPLNGLFYDAQTAVKIHINQEHSSVFEFLMEMDKKYTGLTDHQKNLLALLYQGFNDKEIAARMENSNTSTIRNQRFAFREKTKQAKVFLAMMELLEERLDEGEQFIEIPRTTAMVDERFAITEKENEAIISAYFKAGEDGPLSSFPTKQKRKVAILKHLLQRFDPQKKYSENEVNEILKQAFDDYVTLRRYMIEYGFMDRLPDGSLYWVKN